VRCNRGEKLMAYRKLPSLREYLLLSQTTQSAEVFRRDDSGEWSREEVTANQELRLDSVDFSVSLQVLYDS
jgi:Uma2 family endonuclease